MEIIIRRRRAGRRREARRSGLAGEAREELRARLPEAAAGGPEETERPRRLPGAPRPTHMTQSQHTYAPAPASCAVENVSSMLDEIACRSTFLTQDLVPWFYCDTPFALPTLQDLRYFTHLYPGTMVVWFASSVLTSVATYVVPSSEGFTHQSVKEKYEDLGKDTGNNESPLLRSATPPARALRVKTVHVGSESRFKDKLRSWTLCGRSEVCRCYDPMLVPHLVSEESRRQFHAWTHPVKHERDGVKKVRLPGVRPLVLFLRPLARFPSPRRSAVGPFPRLSSPSHVLSRRVRACARWSSTAS